MLIYYTYLYWLTENLCSIPEPYKKYTHIHPFTHTAPLMWAGNVWPTPDNVEMCY